MKVFFHLMVLTRGFLWLITNHDYTARSSFVVWEGEDSKRVMALCSTLYLMRIKRSLVSKSELKEVL